MPRRGLGGKAGLGLFFVVASAITVAAVSLVGRSSDEAASGINRSNDHGATGEGDYPEEWRTTLEGARSQAVFELIVPNHPGANAGNVTDVFVWPEGHAVAFRFPAPGPAAQLLRQDYIEVFESPWVGGDPAAAWAEDVASADIVGESAFEIQGIPALGVTAHSPTDMDRANPAFLRFVYKGVDIQISGGESLDILIEIAKSIMQ